MTKSYDKYYQTVNLFGNPLPELINFFAQLPTRNRVLDIGCGQGRDAIPIARLGFHVIGIDSSQVGIEQMNSIAKTENLTLNGVVANIYDFRNYADFDVILLDSMFHFTKKDREKEEDLIKNIISTIKDGCHLIICIQDSGKKVEILNKAIDSVKQFPRIKDQNMKYIFNDEESGHQSESKYRMIIIQK